MIQPLLSVKCDGPGCSARLVGPPILPDDAERFYDLAAELVTAAGWETMEQTHYCPHCSPAIRRLYIGQTVGLWRVLFVAPTWVAVKGEHKHFAPTAEDLLRSLMGEGEEPEAEAVVSVRIAE